MHILSKKNVCISETFSMETNIVKNEAHYKLSISLKITNNKAIVTKFCMYKVNTYRACQTNFHKNLFMHVVLWACIFPNFIFFSGHPLISDSIKATTHRHAEQGKELN